MPVSLKYNKIPEDIPRNLNANGKNIGYDTKKLWTEYQLINRMLYRSQNQHKASFSFQHLNEVKRLGERIGKLELLLKANYVENGEKLFDFLGYLNTLRLLINKGIEACRKTFYYYCHYLDQALFVTLALAVVSSVSTLHNELMQWAKYIRLLYNSGIEKLRNFVGDLRVDGWCKENGLEEKLKEPVKSEVLKLPKIEPQNTNQNHPQKMIPSKNKSAVPLKKQTKKTKPNGNINEIDDIFGGIVPAVALAVLKLMPKGDEIVDWILKRKRCPFCAAPFPVLKCVGFELWQCPKCETEFCHDEENVLEPVFNEKYYKTDGIKDHFPKLSSISSHNILCSNCTENQQKIVQLLQSFDTNSSALDHRKQYELYANKLESRYPLCATCSYRVSVQLKRCEEEAGLEERRHTALNGGDWKHKLKLAEKMKWKQLKRKLARGIFFWPDFLFQLFLTVKCVLKDFKFVENEINYGVYGDLKIWLPSKHFNDFGAFYFLICSLLFFIQFNGIAFNRRSPFELVPQLFLSISRLFLGNFLYQKQQEIELNLVLTLAAVGLAVIFKTKSRNALNANGVTFRNQICPDEMIFSKAPLKTNVTQRNCQSDKLGFAVYSENHHRFHSFANQVAPDAAKPIMPWAVKPLPGKLTDARVFNFNENLLSNNSNNSSIGGSVYKMRPSNLNSDDPLELEPMFSSFSLSDEPKTTRRSAIRSSTNSINNTKNASIVPQSITKQSEPLLRSVPKISIGVVYNCLLTSILVAFRVTLMQQTSLISIILALTFGLRGFIWPRLSLKVQLVTLTVAVTRLAWLGVELNGKIEPRLGYVALILDLILIILR